MGPNRRDSTRRARPRLEPLEGRDLPSGLPLLAAHMRPTVAVRAVQKRFTASFSGRAISAPGHDPSIAQRVFVQGAGGSSAFLQGNLLMRLFTPSDPSGDVSGTASLYDESYPQTGTILVLDISGKVGPDGRPTGLTWTVGEGSAGTFTAAQGQGTLRLIGGPGGRHAARGANSGRIGVKFLGQLSTDPTTNSLLVP